MHYLEQTGDPACQESRAENANAAKNDRIDGSVEKACRAENQTAHEASYQYEGADDGNECRSAEPDVESILRENIYIDVRSKILHDRLSLQERSDRSSLTSGDFFMRGLRGKVKKDKQRRGRDSNP